MFLQNVHEDCVFLQRAISLACKLALLQRKFNHLFSKMLRLNFFYILFGSFCHFVTQYFQIGFSKDANFSSGIN